MGGTKVHVRLPARVAATGMTRIRYRVVAFAMALAAITYLDRVCISMLAPDGEFSVSVRDTP